jgi:hypothetical protein
MGATALYFSEFLGGDFERILNTCRNGERDLRQHWDSPNCGKHSV